MPTMTDPVNISSFQYTSQVQGDRRDIYRELSVIASYNNTAVGTQTRHFQLQCKGNQWTPRLNEGLETPPNNYQSLSTRTDCRQCTNAFGDDHHCRPCSPACPGSGRCPGFEMNVVHTLLLMVLVLITVLYLMVLIISVVQQVLTSHAVSE